MDADADGKLHAETSLHARPMPRYILLYRACGNPPVHAAHAAQQLSVEQGHDAGSSRTAGTRHAASSSSSHSSSKHRTQRQQQSQCSVLGILTQQLQHALSYEQQRQVHNRIQASNTAGQQHPASNEIASRTLYKQERAVFGRRSAPAAAHADCKGGPAATRTAYKHTDAAVGEHLAPPPAAAAAAAAAAAGNAKVIAAAAAVALVQLDAASSAAVVLAGPSAEVPALPVLSLPYSLQGSPDSGAASPSSAHNAPAAQSHLHIIATHAIPWTAPCTPSYRATESDHVVEGNTHAGRMPLVASDEGAIQHNTGYGTRSGNSHSTIRGGNSTISAGGSGSTRSNLKARPLLAWLCCCR